MGLPDISAGGAGDFWRLPIKGGDFRGRPGNGGVGQRPTTNIQDPKSSRSLDV